jgi:hypothetical protein
MNAQRYTGSKNKQTQGHYQSPPGAYVEVRKEDTVNGLLTLQQANTYFSNIQKKRCTS